MERRTTAAGLWFAWTLVWNAVVMTTLWLPWMAALILSPTSATFAWWTRLWARVTLFGCGVRVVAERPEAWPPPGPVVYAANHQAMLDIPAVALGLNAPFVFLARSELKRMPLVAGLLRQSLSVFIDRTSARAALEGLAEAEQTLRDGHSILVYPEGTRSYGGALGPFASGGFRLAARADIPVVPVAIEGAWRVLNEKTRQAWPGVVTIRVGAPIPPSADVRALADESHDAVERMLQAPTVSPVA